MRPRRPPRLPRLPHRQGCQRQRSDQGAPRPCPLWRDYPTRPALSHIPRNRCSARAAAAAPLPLPLMQDAAHRVCCADAAAASRQSMWTALHWAVTNEHTECAESLIKAGADTSLKDKVGALVHGR